MLVKKSFEVLFFFIAVNQLAMLEAKSNF